MLIPWKIELQAEDLQVESEYTTVALRIKYRCGHGSKSSSACQQLTDTLVYPSVLGRRDDFRLSLSSYLLKELKILSIFCNRFLAEERHVGRTRSCIAYTATNRLRCTVFSKRSIPYRLEFHEEYKNVLAEVLEIWRRTIGVVGDKMTTGLKTKRNKSIIPGR